MPVSVDYAGGPDCPDALVFGEQLRTRARVQFVSPTEGVTAFSVKLTQSGAQTVGRLVVRDRKGEQSERKVTGDTCAEVVSGLALVAALSLDPSAREQAAPVSPPEPTTKPPEGATPRDAPTPKADVAPSPWSVSIGAGGMAVSDVSSSLLFAVAPFLGVTRRVGGPWAVALELRFSRGSVASVEAATTWTAGGLDLCPFLLWPSRVRLQACARAQAGTLDVIGVNVTPSRGVSRPWLSVGPAASASFYLVERLFARLEGALDVPLVRDRFYFEPETTVFQAPAVGWTATLALGGTIW